MKYSDLSAFFTPRAIAVIGASRSPNKIGRVVFDNLVNASQNLPREHRFKVYAVNPNATKIGSHQCFPRISAIKDKIDLVILAIPAQLVPSVVAECTRVKAKAAIVLSAGFSETGKSKEERALARVKKSLRILGPNTMGIYDAYTKIDTLFGTHHRQARPPPGSIAIISQSGALGAALLDWLALENIGISKFVSIGNSMDVDEIELLHWLSKDPKTSTIAIYLEGTKHGQELIRALKEVGKSKPVVMLKAGRTSAGTRAVLSHTASLAGEHDVWRGALHQSNVIEVSDIEELFDVTKALSMQPASRGSRIAIVTNGGGLGVLSTDEIIEQNLELAEPEKKTLEKIKASVPANASVKNPLDMTADATPHMYRLALEAMLSDRTVDAVLAIVLFQVTAIDPSIIEVLKSAKRFKKPIVVCATGGEFTTKNRKLIENHGIPTYSSPRRAIRAIKALVERANKR